MPEIDIIIRSYYKDFKWLEFCIQSIEIFCTGYRDIIIVVPQNSYDRIRKVSTGPCLVVTCENFKDDYLGQQVTKCYADQYSDADYICHIDSDGIFVRPHDLNELLLYPRVPINYAAYSTLCRQAGYHWKKCTDNFLKIDTTHEFMLQQPYFYPRWVYRALREYCVLIHDVSLYDFILACEPRGFTEFNSMGAFLHNLFPNKFIWNDLSLDERKPPIKNFWSYNGITPAVRREILQYLVKKPSSPR